MLVFAIHQYECMPQVYMCPPTSWTPLPPPSPPHPSGLSQSTGFELAIYFTYRNVLVSMLFSQIIPPSPSPMSPKVWGNRHLPWESEANVVVCEAARHGRCQRKGLFIRGQAFGKNSKHLWDIQHLLLASQMRGFMTLNGGGNWIWRF